MPKRSGPAYVVTTTRHYNGKVYHSHLLRRSYRDGNTVRNETLGNLSHLPDTVIELIRRSLKGETFVPASDAFQVTQSLLHGHVQAVTQAMRKLDLAGLLASRPCRERDLVQAMVAARILAPHTKLATTRWWASTTLASAFGVEDADEQQLYAAMDWLLERQDRIQKKLAGRPFWLWRRIFPFIRGWESGLSWNCKRQLQIKRRAVWKMFPQRAAFPKR